MITAIPGAAPIPPGRGRAGGVYVLEAPGRRGELATAGRPMRVPRADAPLSNVQKASICIKAKAVFARLDEFGLVPGGVDETEWRRREQEKACGHRSLTTATQREWRGLLAHFLDLEGNVVAAFEVGLKSDPKYADRELAWNAAKVATENLGKSWPAWAGGLCRGKYKVALEAAPVAVLWKLTFELRTRLVDAQDKAAGRPRRKRYRTRGGAQGPSPATGMIAAP